jgi:hypothetical protein
MRYAPLLAGLVMGCLGAVEEVTVRVLPMNGWVLVATAPAAAPTASAQVARLERRIDIAIRELSLTEAARRLAELSDLNVAVLPTAPQDQRISLQLTGVRCADACAWIARLAGCPVSFAGEVVVFGATPSVAPITRLYDITDLVTPVPDFPGPRLALTGGRAQLSDAEAVPAAPATEAADLARIVEESLGR